MIRHGIFYMALKLFIFFLRKKEEKMRQMFIVGLAVAFAFAVVGCGGGMNAEKYEKVLGKYYDLSFEAVKKGETFDSNKAWEAAAKEGGFADKKAFDEAVSKWGNADEAAKASKKVSEAYQKKVEEHAKNPPKPAEEKK